MHGVVELVALVALVAPVSGPRFLIMPPTSFYVQANIPWKQRGPYNLRPGVAGFELEFTPGSDCAEFAANRRVVASVVADAPIVPPVENGQISVHPDADQACEVVQVFFTYDDTDRKCEANVQFFNAADCVVQLRDFDFAFRKVFQWKTAVPSFAKGERHRLEFVLKPVISDEFAPGYRLAMKFDNVEATTVSVPDDYDYLLPVTAAPFVIDLYMYTVYSRFFGVPNAFDVKLNETRPKVHANGDVVHKWGVI